MKSLVAAYIQDHVNTNFEIVSDRLFPDVEPFFLSGFLSIVVLGKVQVNVAFRKKQAEGRNGHTDLPFLTL
jgi:hypothetical protein